MCHIVHPPRVRSLIKSFYLQINQGLAVLPGEVALLLSIFALAAYFYEPGANSPLVKCKQDAIKLSKTMSRQALDVLDHSHRSTSGTLEDVQACIFMSFVTYHLDGFSARGRLLTAIAASKARELRLHRLDDDYVGQYLRQNQSNLRSLLDREVKRRVFWHIAASDWYSHSHSSN